MQAKLPDGSIIISGILGQDAEYKQVGQNSSSLTKFSVKVGERPPRNQNEKPQAIWVNCQCWHGTARAAKGLKKLDYVLCVGKLEEHTYTNSQGEQKLDRHLSAEGVFVQPTAAPAEYMPANLPNDYEEILSDEGTPF